MTPEEGPRKFDLKKALGGISGGKKPAPEPAPAKKSADDEEHHAGEPDILARLVGAMKEVAGEDATALGVEPDGYGYLNAVRTGDPIGEWTKWEAIEALQRILSRVGYKVADSGRWDSATTSALRKFQKEKSCPVTGVFDQDSLAALDKVLGLVPGERPKSAQELGGTGRGFKAMSVDRSGTTESGLPASGNAFIDTIAPGAVKAMHQTGIPASVAIAMSVLESNWGERPIARDQKNVFAIKGTGPAGSVVLAEDEEGALVPSGSGELYRVYKDVSDSIVDFAKLFASSNQYQGVMSHRGRADNFARALTPTYSPNPNYGSTLIRIMKQFDLYRYDAVRPS